MIQNFSKSQFGQDIFFLELLNFPKSGFFVEMGAIDGIHNSNTYLLEKKYGFKGIVCEPAKKYHNILKMNRSCYIEHKCVYNKSGLYLEFGETGNWKGGNTLLAYKDNDGKKRKFSEKYYVETITLLELLKKHKAPKVIDFLSLDTEGSEFEILKPFDFNQYKFKVIIVEHNFEIKKRNQIKELLNENNYVNLNLQSNSTVDDWYISDFVKDYYKYD